MSHVISIQQANEFIVRVYEGLGMSAEHAKIVAELMLTADLSGADGHGIFRLPQYASRILDGGINLHPKMHLLKDAPSIGLLHGDNAMGHLVMHECTQMAIEKAKKTGIGWMGCCYGNHAGAGSLYTNLVAQAGFVGMYLAVGSANHMAPWGGIDMLLSTNPIAFSVPMGEAVAPVTLDMATTVAAYGKVKMKVQKGEEMPVGWMIDKQGNPLTDPKRSSEGMLVPIGEYKGYGLSLMIALLAGCMNGASVGSELVDFNADSKAITNTGQTIVAINPDFLGGAEHLIADSNRLVDEIRSSRKLPGVDVIRIPGDGIAKNKATRSVEGIPISETLFKALQETAKRAGVAPLV